MLLSSESIISLMICLTSLLLTSSPEEAHLWGLFPVAIEPEDATTSLLSSDGTITLGFALDRMEPAGLVVEAYFTRCPIYTNDARLEARYDWITPDHRCTSAFIYPLFSSQPDLLTEGEVSPHQFYSFGVLCLDTAIAGTWDRLQLDQAALCRLLRPLRTALLVLYATEMLFATYMKNTHLLNRYCHHEEVD